MRNSNEFVNSSLDREDELLSLLKNFSGTKSEIYLKEVDSGLSEALRFSSLFSDITLINTTPLSIHEYHVSYHTPGSKYFRERQLTIPTEYVKETGIDPKRFLPCYLYRNDSEAEIIRNNFDCNGNTRI